MFSSRGELLVTYNNDDVYLFHPWLKGDLASQRAAAEVTFIFLLCGVVSQKLLLVLCLQFRLEQPAAPCRCCVQHTRLCFPVHCRELGSDTKRGMILCHPRGSLQDGSKRRRGRTSIGADAAPPKKYCNSSPQQSRPRSRNQDPCSSHALSGSPNQRPGASEPSLQAGPADAPAPEPERAVAANAETGATDGSVAAAAPLQADDGHQGDLKPEGQSEVDTAGFAEEDEDATHRELENANNAAEELLRVCICTVSCVRPAACTSSACIVSTSLRVACVAWYQVAVYDALKGWAFQVGRVLRGVRTLRGQVHIPCWWLCTDSSCYLYTRTDSSCRFLGSLVRTLRKRLHLPTLFTIAGSLRRACYKQ